MIKILPKQKQRILAYITEYIDERGYAPTLTDIKEAFNLSSAATVHEHLQYLEDHGFIKRDGREMEVVSQTETKHTERDESETTYNPFFELPVLGLITAGSPIEALEDRSQTLAVPQALVPNENCFVLKVKGDSMVESSIENGDYVICQKQNTAQNGDIVVALLENGTATLKAFYKEKDHVRLQPRNPKYPPILVPSVSIQGKVVGVIRSYH
ncbi:MAG: transcriptional repressor LexA [Candidatus Kerfeldbacteria bacterium]|nr:transcriptional repressor LexA [Candidatus Kerfeldbacteria bacterium]